jgi:hypothetical protein
VHPFAIHIEATLLSSQAGLQTLLDGLPFLKPVAILEKELEMFARVVPAITDCIWRQAKSRSHQGALVSVL